MSSRDAEAADWYSGRQSVVPVQSIHHERHFFLDGKRRSRSPYRACQLSGGRSPRVVDGMVRTGGAGIVDMRSGRLVIRTIEDWSRPDRDCAIAEIVADIMNEGVLPCPTARTGRHQVEIEQCRWPGFVSVTLTDRRARSSQLPILMCRMPVNPFDQPGIADAFRLLEVLAASFDRNPINWTTHTVMSQNVKADPAGRPLASAG